MKFRYPDLLAALESWTECALPFLRSRMEQHPLETRDASIWSTRLVSEAFNPQSTIRVLPETRVLGQAVAAMPQFAEDAVTNEDWHNPGLPPIQASLKFGAFLHAYLGDDLDWTFDPSRFAAVYQEFEAFLDDPGAISLTVRIEVWNLQSKRRTIHLADGVTVRRVTAAERKRLIATSRATARFGPPERFDTYGMDPPTPGLYLELTRHVRDYTRLGLLPHHAASWGVAEDVRQTAHALLLGLRLLTPGDFGIGLYDVASNSRMLNLAGPTSLSVAPDWPPPKVKKPRSGWQRPRRREALDSPWGSYTRNTPLGPPVILTAGMAKDLQRLWPLLVRTLDDKLTPAFHRFELSYERTDPEDRLIDYWVALESLFLPGSDRELGRAASQRLAFFIEGANAQRLAVYRTTKKSYSFRSDVVHSNAYDPADVEDYADQIADYLRRTLLKCLKANAPPDTATLDQQMMFVS